MSTNRDRCLAVLDTCKRLLPEQPKAVNYGDDGVELLFVGQSHCGARKITIENGDMGSLDDVLPKKYSAAIETQVLSLGDCEVDLITDVPV